MDDSIGEKGNKKKGEKTRNDEEKERIREIKIKGKRQKRENVSIGGKQEVKKNRIHKMEGCQMERKKKEKGKLFFL